MALKEEIFNLFCIFKGDILTRIGFKIHKIEGTDEEKIIFLQSNVESDLLDCCFMDIPDNFTIKLPDGGKINGLTLERYNTLLYNGTLGILFEPIFNLFNTTEKPLTVTTCIVDGKIKIDEIKQYPTKPLTSFTEQIHEELPNHYLTEFITEEGFELEELINKDFFDAIKLLFNNRHFVSSLKLLMSAIDTIAFLEYGDISNNFKEWLKKYCDFSMLSITEEELWEFRNSILHMTNACSRKVKNKKVSPLKFYISPNDKSMFISDNYSKYFNLTSFISIISNGVTKWAESFNLEKDKFEVFCDRYDYIISDNRYSKIRI